MRSEHAQPLNIGDDRLVTINDLVDYRRCRGQAKRIRRRHDLTQAQGVRGRNSDNTRCEALLGWRPAVSLEQGMAQTYAWIHEQLHRAGRHRLMPRPAGLRNPHMTPANAIPQDIFRRYDIRGRAEGPQVVLTADIARHIGRACATLLRREHGVTRVVLGRDNRLSSPALHAAAREGLLAGGCELLDIGLTPTPLLYHSVVNNGHSAGLMVTGSHLPPAFQRLQVRAGRAEFVRRIAAGHCVNLPLRRTLTVAQVACGVVRGVSLYKPWAADLGAASGRNVPCASSSTPGNGTAGLVAADLLRALGHELVHCLFCEPDGRYPNHQPDPGAGQTLTTAVRGSAADRRGHRPGIRWRRRPSGRGRRARPHRRAGPCAHAAGLDLLRRRPGARILADVSCSQVFLDELRRAGGQPMLCATGHALVKAQLVACQGPSSAAKSAATSFFAEDHHGYDDPFFRGRTSAAAARGRRRAALRPR